MTSGFLIRARSVRCSVFIATLVPNPLGLVASNEMMAPIGCENTMKAVLTNDIPSRILPGKIAARESF